MKKKSKLENFLDKHWWKLSLGSLALTAVSGFGIAMYKLGFKDGAYKASADCLRYLNDIADDDNMAYIGDIVMKKK